MPNDYMVRITHSFQDASGVVALWAARADKMVVYEHIGEATEKIHVHLVIAGSSIDKKQLRNIAMATGLPLKGNEYCSFKKFDGNTIAMIYCTKGKFNPSFIKGYTPAEADKWKSLWREGMKKEPRIAQLYNQLFDDDDNDDISFKYWERANPYDGGKVWRTQDRRFLWCKQMAHTHAFNSNGRFWTLKTANEYKALVYTYCARHNIIIPDKDEVFKRF